MWCLLCELYSFNLILYILFLQVGQKSVCVFFISTYTNGDPPESAAWFCKWLGETALDFRVSKTLLQGFGYAVVALGSSAYQPDAFCKVSLGFLSESANLDRRMRI